MTDERTDAIFETLVGVLALAMGPAHAVTLDDMAVRLGVCRRTVEQVIQERLERFPFALVAGSDGYYRPTCAEQINAYRASLRRRHLPLKQREETVTAKAAAEGWRLEGDTFVETAEARQFVMLGA
jgi:hypothetical protein